MAFTFQNKPTATIRAKSASSTEILSIAGVNVTENSADTAATQINKLLAIGGLSIVADASMKRITTEEVVDNG